MTPRPLRILEIGCGKNSSVPAYAAERHPGRSIEYVGIDANEKGVDDEWGGNNWKVTETYHFEKLDFRNPQRLRNQLLKRIGETRFDEIHWHMPYGTQFEDTHGKVLSALSDRLNDEGRLFHTFQQHSPLLEIALRQPDFSHQHISDAAVGRIHTENRRAIDRMAADVGMQVRQYAVRAFRTVPMPGTEIGLLIGMPPLFAKSVPIRPWFDGSERNHDAIDRFVRTHSHDARFAAHALELVKKATRAGTKVRRRK